MKLVLSSIFLSLFVFCGPVFGVDLTKTYIIKVSGIKIGRLDWQININKKSYKNNIRLKSGGLLSSLYKFEGEYFSGGDVISKNLKPKKYTHLWKTNKITKKMSLVFHNNKLESMVQTPIESIP